MEPSWLGGAAAHHAALGDGFGALDGDLGDVATSAQATVKLTVQLPDPIAMAWCRDEEDALLLRRGAGRQLVKVERDRLPGILADLVAGRRGHWRIDARLLQPAGHAILEAIDGPGGWWLIRPEGQQVTAESTTATTLWTHLTELAAG